MVELQNKTTDVEELKAVISSLKMEMFKGCENTCPKCKRTGHFGSIIRYRCESDKIYLVCAWCGTITDKPTKQN